MGLVAALKFAFIATRRYPRILLPAIIGWIPSVMAMFFLALFLSDFSFIAFQEMLETATSTELLLAYGPATAIVGLAYWVTFSFITVVYADLTRQFSKKKKPNIATSFYAAKKFLFPEMLINLIVMAILAVSISMTLAASSALQTALPFWSGVVGFGGLFLSLYVLGRVSLAPVVLVLENRHRFDAIRRSWHVTRNLAGHVLTAVFVISLTDAYVKIFLSNVPYFSVTFVMLASLFFTTWIMTALPALYYEYGLAKR